MTTERRTGSCEVFLVTPSRSFMILSTMAMGTPVLLFLTPLGKLIPTPVFLMIYGLTLLFQPFAELGCWAIAGAMALRRTGSPEDRLNVCMLGTAFAFGYVLFVLLLLS